MSLGRMLKLVKLLRRSYWLSFASEEIRVESTDALQTTLVEMNQQRCSLMCSVRSYTRHFFYTSLYYKGLVIFISVAKWGTCSLYSLWGTAHTYPYSFENATFFPVFKKFVSTRSVFASFSSGLKLILWRQRFRKVPTGSKFTCQFHLPPKVRLV